MLEMLGVPLNIFFLCLLAGGTRIFLAVEPPTVKGIIGTILAAIFMAAILYPFLDDEDYGKGFVTLLVAVGSFTARDILMKLPILVHLLSKDPVGVLREYLNWRANRRSGDDQ